jgi:hypothetical protein
MREFCEFRVWEKLAPLVFREDEGEFLGVDHPSLMELAIRKVVVETNSPKFHQVGEVSKRLRKEQGEAFFGGWNFIRKYSPAELDEAELFCLNVYPFEPTGEMCGTEFDVSAKCPHCGAGRRQLSDLILDLRKAPRSRDITSTLAENEWIVSQRLAELMVEAKLTGVELRPVRHQARYRDDAIDHNLVPSGRRLEAKAASLGLEQTTWEYAVWINSSEQQSLLEAAWDEYAEMREAHDKRKKRQMPVWYQLWVTSRIGRTVPPTRFGINPFDEDSEGKYRCPLGHTSGLNLLSEVHVSRDAWDGSDVTLTENLVGHHPADSLIYPEPLLLVSARFWRLLTEHKMKRFTWEVAHLI